LSPPMPNSVLFRGPSARRPGTVFLIVVQLSMLAPAMGCKPSDEPLRSSPLPDPTAHAVTILPGDGADTWLASQVAAHRDRLARIDAGPSPAASRSADDGLIASARDAFNRKDFASLIAVSDSDASHLAEVGELVVRARAIQGRTKEALDALARLAELPDADAFLTRLRLHPDTQSLRNDDRFRKLVRFVPVELSPTRRGDAGRLTPLLNALRAAGIPARSGKRWRGKVDGATIYYTRDLPDAEAVARELHDVLALPPQMLASKYLKRKRPIVLVLPPPAIAALNPADRKTRVEDFLGRSLHARDGSDEHEFLLRDTGFFRWVTRSPGNRFVERTGRYYLYATKIALSYRVLQHRGDPKTPSSVEQGRRSTHRFRLAPDGFRLDGWTFRTR